MIAALFVATGGVYFGLPGVDPWDEPRDARNYAGPFPVIAHPPCERWGRYWWGGPSARERKVKGDDGGCFAAALGAVRKFGGVLEHPANSSAWKHFGLTAPARNGGWTRADGFGWTCCVDQGNYGHLAKKRTWLYAVGTMTPEMRWGEAQIVERPLRNPLPPGRRASRTGMCQRLSHRQRAATPAPFRDLLLGLIRG